MFDMPYASAIAVIMGIFQLAGLLVILLLRKRMVTAATVPSRPSRIGIASNRPSNTRVPDVQFPSQEATQRNFRGTCPGRECYC
jgi:hypothetical protein